MNYITIDIFITKDQSTELGNTYLVGASEKTTHSPVFAQASFTISTNIEQRLHKILTENNLRAPEGQASHMKDLGIELFNYIFQNDTPMKRLYENVKYRAAQQPSVIRLRLHIAPAELSTLPWELLHDATEYLCLSSRPKFLFARVPDPIVQGKKTPSYQLPLRLLGITACPNGDPELDVEKEKRYINIALEKLTEEKRVEVKWTKAEASVVSEHRLGNPWHMLHFIGHGHFDEKEQHEGTLIFEDSSGKRLNFNANRFHHALHKDIQLVFLNACDTARGNSRDYLSNFAYRLAILGVPAIVAMQCKITDSNAIQFARVFYETVACGGAVDEAVAEARRHIYVTANRESFEWIAPILYISTTRNILFKEVKGDAPTGKSNAKEKEKPDLENHIPSPQMPPNQNAHPQNSHDQSNDPVSLTTTPTYDPPQGQPPGQSNRLGADGVAKAATYIKEGDTLYDRKKFKEALAAYKRAVDLEPNNAKAYNRMGDALYGLKRYEETLLVYEKAIALSPNDPYAYYWKGLTLDELAKQEKDEQARKKLRERAQQARKKAKELGLD